MSKTNKRNRKVGNMVDILTPQGHTKFMRSTESLKLVVISLSEAKPKKIVIVQLAGKEQPLGTTDGVSYTIRPRA